MIGKELARIRAPVRGVPPHPKILGPAPVEVCATEVLINYDTAECRCAKREEPEGDEISMMTPFAILTIPTLAPGSVSDDLLDIEQDEEPQPEAEVEEEEESRESPPSTELLSDESELTVESFTSPSTVEPSDDLLSMDSGSIPGPSPIPSPESLLGPSISASSVSSPTESDAIQPPIPELLWAPESDESYESSMLRASPSVQLLALAEGPDTSFETSFLRPSGSVFSSQDISLMTPITEVSSPSSMTVPSSPSLSATPTPPSVSLSPSVPSPTPISTESVAMLLTHTPSSVLTASSISMSSYILNNRSLFEVPTIIEPAISTEPSLLSTVCSLSPLSSISPLAVPLPPSPALTAPSVSMSVSVSTPRGDNPSIMSELDTIPSEAPSHILTHNVNRLLQYLHDVDDNRAGEIRDPAENVQLIREELGALSDHVRSREVPEAPPPVPYKDRSVGRSSVVSSVRSQPGGPRSPLMLAPPSPRPTSVHLSSPRTPSPCIAERDVVAPSPQRGGLQHPSAPRAISITLSSPPSSIPTPESLMSDGMLFLSSHHSDDLSLMESESYPIRAPSPSWPSSPGSSEPSSPAGVESEFSASSFTPTPPPSSPSPSSSSSGTARPVPLVNVNMLRDILEAVQQQVEALRQGQTSTNNMLDELRDRPIGQDLAACCERIDRLEEALQRWLEQAQQAQVPTGPTHDDCSESIYVSGSETSSLMDRINRLREEVARANREVPPIHMPIPVRVGPSFDEQMAEILATGPPAGQHPVQQPPPLVPLIYRPGPRVARPCSASPVFEADLPPQPGTFPITQPVEFEWARTGAQWRVPRRQFAAGPRDGVPGDVDFERVIHDRCIRRQGGDGFYGSHAEEDDAHRRPGTAPPDISGERADGPVGMPAAHAPPMAPPGTFMQGGPTPVQPGAFAPGPSGPTILQLPPTFDNILTVLRENRLAQLASIDQQREMMRYLRGLNEWLE
ncbi:hypothetical protein B0H21DRAFT_834543 [Amylocystis lapponica]|nr:hypothetical protein B0H21DRAFT_834543 [Amylocystis lapponica]